jgi:phosphatidylglycerophosphatase A
MVIVPPYCGVSWAVVVAAVVAILVVILVVAEIVAVEDEVVVVEDEVVVVEDEVVAVVVVFTQELSTSATTISKLTPIAYIPLFNFSSLFCV